MHLVALMRSQDRLLGVTLLTLLYQDSVMAPRCMAEYWVMATRCSRVFLLRL